MTVTGVSAVDQSIESYTERFWQPTWPELRFDLYDGGSHVTHDGEYISTNNLSISVISRSQYTITLMRDNDWVIFDYDGNIKTGPATTGTGHGLDTDYNVGDDVRTLTIVVRNQTTSTSKTYYQSPDYAYWCSVSQTSSPTAPASGGRIDVNFSYSGFDVIYGISYSSYEDEVEDASLVMSTGSGNGTAEVVLYPNTTGRSRTIVLTIQGNNRNAVADISGEIYITQEG